MRIFVAPDIAGQPDAVISGLWVSLPFPYRARDRHLVIAETMTSTPAGCFDMGDPLDAAWMAGVPTRTESRAVESAMGEPRDSMLNLTRHQILEHMLDHPSGVRFVQPRFRSVPLTPDIIGFIFTQTKPVR